MSQLQFIALVFAAGIGIGVGYGLRSYMVIMHREKVRRRM